MTIRELTFDEVDLVSGGSDDEEVDEIVVVGTRRSEGVRVTFFGGGGHVYTIGTRNWEEIYTGPVGEADQARQRRPNSTVIVGAVPTQNRNGTVVWNRVYVETHEA